MAMYANVVWRKVSNTAEQPTWMVLQTVWDANGNIVFDAKGKAVLVAKLQSPPPTTFIPPPPPPPPPGSSPDSTNIPIIGA